MKKNKPATSHQQAKIYAGLLWLDFVSGCDNGADVAKK
jgi:hypothetical protein